jgi:hypothetical protein
MAKLSRREFLYSAAAAGLALALRPRLPAFVSARSAASRAASNRVVHAHSAAATFWDYAEGWYGDYVSQAAVDQMTDAGVMELTGAASRAAAWGALIPGYSAGENVAIKINLNNAAG